MDFKKIKKLLKLMDDNELSEISVKEGEDAISLKKKSGDPVISAIPQVVPLAQPAATPQESASPAKDTDRPANVKEVTSPMVGTFYRSPSPEADSYVEVGSQVKPGDVLCILEAMKLMNEVKSEVSGKIVKILVENAQPVEFGQALFWVE